MKVYIAGPYAARDRLRGCAAELERVGYRVTSTWLKETHEIGESTVAAATGLDDEQVDAHARQDMRDIDRADILVGFTAAAAGPLDGLFGSSGGRHVELGYALARGKPVLVVGEPENVFHRLAAVTVVPTWHEAVLELAARLVNRGAARVEATS